MTPGHLQRSATSADAKVTGQRTVAVQGRIGTTAADMIAGMDQPATNRPNGMITAMLPTDHPRGTVDIGTKVRAINGETMMTRIEVATHLVTALRSNQLQSPSSDAS